jgi:hypothetical protein
MRYSNIVIACVGLIFAGCPKQTALPTLPATIRVTAQLYSVPDMGIEGIDRVEVPQDHVPQILKIVTPVTFIKGGVVPELNYHVADVYLHHEDFNVTKIKVRFTGHNPAAVTVDGVNYFYASVDGPADGARGLARLLARFHFEAQHNKQHDK